MKHNIVALVLGSMLITTAGVVHAQDVYVQMNILDSADKVQRGIIYTSATATPFIKLAVPVSDIFYNQVLLKFMTGDLNNITCSEKIIKDCKNAISAIQFDKTHVITLRLIGREKITMDSSDEVKGHLKSALDTFFNVVKETCLDYITFSNQGIGVEDADIIKINSMIQGMTWGQQDPTAYKNAWDSIKKKYHASRYPIINLKDNESDIAKPVREIYIALKRLGESFGFEVTWPINTPTYAKIGKGISKMFSKYRWYFITAGLALTGYGLYKSGAMSNSMFPASAPTPPSVPGTKGFWAGLTGQ